jgi:hypothetical protein
LIPDLKFLIDINHWIHDLNAKHSWCLISSELYRS